MTTFKSAIVEVTSAPGIPDLLRFHEIRGKREDCFNCPVVNFIAKRIGDQSEIAKITIALTLFDELGFDEELYPVQWFIQDFDLGYHPDLEA